MPASRRALALAVALCLLPAVSRADDPYADFRIPEHRTFSWSVSTSANLLAGYSGDSFERDRNRRFQGRFMSPLAWHAELESRQYDLSVEPFVVWDRVRSQTDLGDALVDQRVVKSRFDNQALSAFASRNDYLAGSRWFLAYRAQGTVSLLEEVSSADQHRVDATTEQFSGNMSARRDYRYSGTASLGVGLGRIRDVSGVYAVQLLEQRLRVSGALTRPLSTDARRRLASLYYVRADFGAAHDRPEKYFWREVERVLREDGALAGSALDAWSLERLLEPASRMGNWQRARGTSLAVTFGGTTFRGHADQDNELHDLVYSGGVLGFSSASTSSSRQHFKQDRFTPLARFDLDRPIGMRWQLALSAAGQYSVDWTHQLNQQSSAGVTWLVADRWYASGTVEQFATSLRVNGVRPEPLWTTRAAGTLGYWVEDAWSVELNLEQQQRMSHIPFSFPGASYVRSASLEFGLTYRPAGRFKAPGLGISERLTTPPL